MGFLQRLNASIVSYYVQIGDRPHLEKLIGPVKALIDMYADGRIDAVYVAYSRFINTMKQEPVIEQLLPLSYEQPRCRPRKRSAPTRGTTSTSPMRRR